MTAPGNLGRIKGLRNLFMAPLTVDTSAETTYGTAISLGARSKMSFQPVGRTADLETSQGIENSDTVWTHATWSMEYGEINLAALNLAYGGKLHDDDAGGKSILAFVQGGKPGYFALIGQPDLVEGGPADFWLALCKCKVENGSPFELGDKWVMNQLSGRAFYTLKDHLLWGMAFLDAKTDVTADVIITDLASAVTGGT